MTEDDKVFYSKEWTTILDSLLKFFPYSLAFKLFDIQEKEKLTYSDLLTDGLSNNPDTYKLISDYLVYNDFAKYAPSNSNYIILTGKGRDLIQSKTFDKYVEYDNLKRIAEIRDLKIKKHYKLIEFLKMFISFILGLVAAYITYIIFPKC